MNKIVHVFHIFASSASKTKFASLKFARDEFKTLSKINDEVFLSETVNAINCFRKKKGSKYASEESY